MQNSQSTLTRRRFLALSLQLSAGFTLIDPLDAMAALLPRSPLRFKHTHTGERLVINPTPTKLKSSDLEQLNYFLRDFRTDDIYPIDAQLLSVLHGIRALTGSKGMIEVISGYRSPKTNMQLRQNSGGVARKSLHLKGQAIDVRFSDVRTSKVRDAAIRLQRGGVGYYWKSDFVHIDTGRVRTW